MFRLVVKIFLKYCLRLWVAPHKTCVSSITFFQQADGLFFYVAFFLFESLQGDKYFFLGCFLLSIFAQPLFQAVTFLWGSLFDHVTFWRCHFLLASLSRSVIFCLEFFFCLFFFEMWGFLVKKRVFLTKK